MKEFDKVIGYEAVKQELIRISDALKNNEAYTKLYVNAPQGLLLHGKPGVGKTLMASCVIAASGRKAFICRKDKPKGDFVNAIKKTFSDAKAAAPSIVFLDDMDKFANGDDSYPDTEEYVTVQSCIDEVKNAEVFVLATANNVRVLPDSLKRAGRFDRIIKIDNPSNEDAVRIVDHYIKKKRFVGNIDAVMVAKMMNGHSCADLESVINEAGLYAGFERSDIITEEHFMKACLHTVHNVPNEALLMEMPKVDLSDGKDQLTRVIYHEAGHAAIAELLNPGAVTLVCAYSRSGLSGGFTSFYRSYKNDSTDKENPDFYDFIEGMKYQGNNTFDELCADICASLGGMAALEQKFGVIDLGTRSDLERAFRCVKELVAEECIYGFHLHSDGFLQNESEDLKSKQEHAVATEITRFYRKAKEILSVNHELLDAIALELSRKGVLTAKDIAEIKKNCRVIPVDI